MDKLQLLKKLFLFCNVDFNELDRRYSVSANVTEAEYKAGEIILSTDEKPVGIGIVSSGKALISTSVHGNAPMLRSLSAGDTFGAASLFMKERGYATGVVSDTESTIIYIPLETVRYLCAQVPQIAMNYIEFLSDRIAFLNTKVSTFSAQSADGRIAYYIHRLVDGGEGSAELPVSYIQLAKMLGIGRASLYRALDSFCDAEIISRDGRTITVLRPDELRKIYN